MVHQPQKPACRFFNRPGMLPVAARIVYASRAFLVAVFTCTFCPLAASCRATGAPHPQAAFSGCAGFRKLFRPGAARAHSLHNLLIFLAREQNSPCEDSFLIIFVKSCWKIRNPVLQGGGTGLFGQKADVSNHKGICHEYTGYSPLVWQKQPRAF